MSPLRMTSELESCFMHAASEGHTRFQKIKKSKLIENLNDAYGISYRCLCLQHGNKVKMKQIIVFMRNRELAF